MLFECHITISPIYAFIAEGIAKEQHWKTSEIARDPVLGQESYFYLTTHANDWQVMFERMQQCSCALKLNGIPVIREKIEMILHDTKVKV